MAETRSDKIRTVVAVTETEMKNLLAAQAQSAGFIDYTPDSVGINPTSLQIDQGDGIVIDEPGYEITFTGPRA